jgi:hypothetical protein
MSEHEERKTDTDALPTARVDGPAERPTAKVRPFEEPALSPPVDILEETKFFLQGSVPPPVP